jgi:penicillin V acylase-like amidase (Ntn superfamily)
MRNILILMFSMICLPGVFINPAFSCTMVMVAKDDVILAGNNEDWKNPETRMWVYPASKSEYSRVCFGFDDGFTQGGMNDRGLFIDANALAPTRWKPSPGKPYFRGNLMDHILAHCATVDEAANFFRKYNFPSLERAKFPIADAKGDSAVIEWGQRWGQVFYLPITPTHTSTHPQVRVLEKRVLFRK